MGQAPIKMLTIDDRMLTTDLDRAGYRNMGISVHHVTTFAEAQQKLANEKIDIIVINLDYQKIDALGLCKHFKAHEPINQIPIVITSVQTTAAARNSALAAGANLFIEQPLPRQYFIEKLKKLLDQMTRTDDRITLEEKVSVVFNNDRFRFEIADLSKTGMFAMTDSHPIPEGSKVEVSFSLNDGKPPLGMQAIVVRHVNITHPEPRQGLGIRFEKFHGDSERRLERYVAQRSDSSGKMAYYL